MTSKKYNLKTVQVKECVLITPTTQTSITDTMDSSNSKNKG